MLPLHGVTPPQYSKKIDISEKRGIEVNINQCIALKLLEENLTHFISQRGNNCGGNYDQCRKRPVRHKIPHGIEYFEFYL